MAMPFCDLVFKEWRQLYYRTLRSNKYLLHW
jgi:hypothetical protein